MLLGDGIAWQRLRLISMSIYQEALRALPMAYGQSFSTMVFASSSSHFLTPMSALLGLNIACPVNFDVT